ncbi:MAG: FkbM family methyltransferase [Marmoricola sp.]
MSNARTLAALLRDFAVERVDLLKMDCEGGEYKALLGCDEDVLDKIGTIVMELHEAPGHSAHHDELIRFLQRAGFAVDVYAERTSGAMRLCMTLFTK